MRGQLFQGIKQWEFNWQDIAAKLPVFYYDNTSITATYTASTAAVQSLLPHPDMKLVELYPGRCLVAFTAFEYRKTDIDAYNEFSIAFLISFGKPQLPGLTAAWQMSRRRLSAYIWQLPVTTEIARVGGVEMYGYPKFLADIDFQRDTNWLRCDLAEKGEKILSLTGKVLPTKRGKQTHIKTYSVLEGIPLAANVHIDPLEHAETLDSGAATLELGDNHPICSRLKQLELSDKPVMYQYSPVTEAILFGGRNLADS